MEQFVNMTACIDCHDTLLPHPQRPVSPHDQSDTRTVHKLRILKIKNNPVDLGSAHDPVRLLSDPVRLRMVKILRKMYRQDCVFEFKQLIHFHSPCNFFTVPFRHPQYTNTKKEMCIIHIPFSEVPLIAFCPCIACSYH